MGQTERAALKHVYYHMHSRWWEVAILHRELNSVLYDNLEEWEWVRDGREAPEGEKMCIPVADSCCCMAETNTTL